MKTLFPKVFSLVILAGILFESPGFAQSTDLNGSLMQPEKDPHLKLLRTSAGDLREVVDLLQTRLENDKLEPINVIFGSGTETQPVPELVLRNVSGPDALQLIATAAGCEADPLVGASRNVIGYRLTSGPGSARPLSAGMSAPPAATASRTYRSIPRTGRRSESASASPTSETRLNVPATSSKQTAGSVGNYSVPLGGDSRSRNQSRGQTGINGRYRQALQKYTDETSTVSIFGGAPAARNTALATTRVYPLAAITASTKVADIEVTLSASLEVDGISSDDVKLVFHDKTGVLVVRGDDRAHDLVNDLLESLTANQSVVSNRDSARELVELRIELEAQLRSNERLQEQLDLAAAEARAMAKENSRLTAMLENK